MIRVFGLATLLALTPQQPRDGSVEITLRDSLTHKGIPAVRAILVLTGPPNNVTTLFTDSEGRAAARNLTYGNYVLRIESDFYRPAVRIPGTDNSSVNLSISSDRPTYRLETELKPIATLSGRVLYPNGDPFPRARVALLTETYSNGRRGFSNARTEASQSETDDRGSFRFSGVLPGEYYIRIENLDAQHLPRLTYFPGVTDSASAATVAIRGMDLSLEIRIARQPAFKISGTVVSPIPMRLGGVSFGSSNPEALEEQILPTYVEPSSPNEFHFEIAGIPAGSYFLYPRINSGTGDLINKVSFIVVDRDMQDIRITMQPAVDLSGKIILLEGDEAGVRRDSIKVATRVMERLPILGGDMARDIVGVTVSQTGEFVLPRLTPDTRFAVRASGLPPDAYVSDVRQGGRSVYNEGFIRSNPAEGAIEIHIDARGGTITGSVRDVLNQGARQIVVVAVPDALRRANPLLFKRATTDSNGEFSLRGIAPGEYQLFAWTVPPPEGAEQDIRFLAPYEGKGSIVRVTRGGRTEAILRLLPQ
jgi:hypothetical protein